MAYQFTTKWGSDNNAYGFDPKTGANLGRVYRFGNVNNEESPYAFTLPAKWLEEQGGFTYPGARKDSITLNPQTLQAILADQAFPTSGVYDTGTPWTGDPSKIGLGGTGVSYSRANDKDGFMLDTVLPALATAGFAGPAIGGLTSGLGLPSLPSLTDLLPDMFGNTTSLDVWGNPVETGAISGGSGTTGLLGGNIGNTGTDVFQGDVGGDLGAFDPGGELYGTGSGAGAIGSYETPDWAASTQTYGGAVPPYDNPSWPLDDGSMGGTYDLPAKTGGMGGVFDSIFKDPFKTALSVTPAILGAFASNSQSEALKDLANQNRSDRAPFLNKSKEWLNNPQAFYEGPGMSAMNATLNALSSKFGNPIGSGAALGIATDAGMKNWSNTVQGLGSIGVGGQGIQSQLDLASINSNANVLNALGAGLRDLTRGDDSTLEGVLNSLAKAGKLSISLNTGVA